MIARRRFGLPIACVVLALAALIARLYQVQVVEHDVWAGQAAQMVREAHTIPYLRGRILDRDGEVLVQDEESYAVRFVYREFRREHALGQVAHARGALTNRRVSLQEAALDLEAWGLALVESAASEVYRFARGEPAQLCGHAIPAAARGEPRRRRAGELRFYTRGLLGVTGRDWSAIRKRLSKGRDVGVSWVSLVARQEGLPEAEVRGRVERSLSRSLARLERLAVLMEVTSLDGLLPVDGEEALWFLIEGLEAKRVAVEAAIAGDLFEEATGFEAGRLEPELLLATFDLGFLAEELDWSAAELTAWAEEARASWLEDRRSFHVPRAVIRARLREDAGEDALDAFFGELAWLFAPKPRTARERSAARREWRRISEAAVFVELEQLFEALPLEAGPPPLAFLDPAVRRLRREGAAERDLLRALIPFAEAARIAPEFLPAPRLDSRGEPRDPWPVPASLDEAVERVLWQLHPRRQSSADLRDPSRAGDEEELLPWVAALWEARFRGALEERLADLLETGEEEDLSLPLALRAGRLEAAREKADYFVRDRGSRPELLDEAPDQVVVNTLTRFVEAYRGFEVEARTRRLAMALDRDGDLVARPLVGVVREASLEEVLEQRADRVAFARVLARETRSAEEEALARDLHGRFFRPDEVRGTSGIEGLMDEALRGTNGFVEDQGLQQREEGTRSSLSKEKVDGLDVMLTLDLDLQQAAQRTIEHPSLPLGETHRDEHWFRNPVGAIVLATVDGEVLAAASCPKEAHETDGVRDGERAYDYERCLRRPRFQPLGSIFKPFVAAYALARAGLRPEQVFECAPRADGTAGWNKVACHQRFGHGVIDLEEAILHSCNAYFAQVGELLQSKEGLRDLAHDFGFDRPTGVRDAGGGGGLVEVFQIPSLNEGGEFSLTDLNRAGNGLAVVEGTPMQVARAMAGLATGRLPSMRLVRRVGEEPVAFAFEEVELSASALAFVRQAMEGVITEGSAREKGLSEEVLGFRLAGKTGSADYRRMSPGVLAQLELPADARPPQVRKHTWFAGFFPAEAPRAVVVVYCHDIGVTSSHSAVHVAAQFLKTPELQAWVRGAL